ncbi:MAG: hypothetical protein MO852_08270 [Candidatus Devosia euplotis]|nr:hypothetical protein [Candidatus Devosia euplotis]
MRRVDAYIETIRRERSNKDLVAMSDAELRDLLHSGAHNMRVAGERKNWLLLGAGEVTLFSAVVAVNQDGMRGFAIAMVMGAIVIYGFNEYLIRRLRDHWNSAASMWIGSRWNRQRPLGQSPMESAWSAMLQSTPSPPESRLCVPECRLLCERARRAVGPDIGAPAPLPTSPIKGGRCCPVRG